MQKRLGFYNSFVAGTIILCITTFLEIIAFLIFLSITTIGYKPDINLLLIIGLIILTIYSTGQIIMRLKNFIF